MDAMRNWIMQGFSRWPQPPPSKPPLTSICGDRRLARRSWKRDRVRSLCEESWLCWKRCLPAREVVRPTEFSTRNWDKCNKALSNLQSPGAQPPHGQSFHLSAVWTCGPNLLSKTLVGDRASKASFRQEFSTRGWDLVFQSNDPRANSPKPLPVFAGVGRHHAATGHLSPHVGRGEARTSHRGAP